MAGVRFWGNDRGSGPGGVGFRDFSLCLPVRVRTQTGSEPSEKKPVRAWRAILDLFEKLLDEEGTS